MARAKVKVEKSLNSYGPDGQVLAQSYDGGKTWQNTEAGDKFGQRLQKPQVYTRRVAAITDDYTPSTARRIETPFTRLHEIGVMAGVMPLSEAQQMEEEQMDGLLIPGLLPKEHLESLKPAARSLLMDLDAPMLWDDESREILYETIGMYDAVIVPTPLLATRIGAYHKRVFVMPHMLREDLWAKKPTPPRREVINIAVPMTLDDVLSKVMYSLNNIYQDRIQVIPFEWYTKFPVEEVETYPEFDVVVLPPPHDRYQGSLAPVLPAMAAGCTVIAERHWSGLNHQVNALIVSKHQPHLWLNELRKVITNRSLRRNLAYGAKNFAYRYTTDKARSSIFLPYRLVVPEGKREEFAKLQ